MVGSSRSSFWILKGGLCGVVIVFRNRFRDLGTLVK